MKLYELNDKENRMLMFWKGNCYGNFSCGMCNKSLECDSLADKITTGDMALVYHREKHRAELWETEAKNLSAKLHRVEEENRKIKKELQETKQKLVEKIFTEGKELKKCPICGESPRKIEKGYHGSLTLYYSCGMCYSILGDKGSEKGTCRQDPKVLAKQEKKRKEQKKLLEFVETLDLDEDEVRYTIRDGGYDY